MLHVTTDMIRELLDAGARPHDTRIVYALHLTPEGWSVDPLDAAQSDGPLVALTAEEVQAILGDSSDADETADIVEGLAEEQYRIPHASGQHHEPALGAHVVVVTGTYTGDTPHKPTPGEVNHSQDNARWIDVHQATRVTETDIEDVDGHRSGSLWLTPDGTGYLLELRSQHRGEPEAQWLWLSPEGALTLLFHTPEQHWRDDAPRDHPLLAAAPHVRGLVHALASPTLRESGEREKTAEARGLVETTTTAVHASRVVSDFLRITIAPALRAERSAAARLVVRAYDGDRSAAAGHLHMHYQTLANLL